MRRPAVTWALFAVGLAVLFGGLAWVTLTALDLDRAEIRARCRADREESIRLALWRMDSQVAPLLASEGARPYFHYTAFYAADRAYTRMYNVIGPGEVQFASPLLTPEAPAIRLYFQIGVDGALTSPQVPTSNMLDVAESGYVEPQEIGRRTERLAELDVLLGDGIQRGKMVSTLACAVVAEPPIGSDLRGVDGAFGGRGGQELQARRNFARNAWSQSPLDARGDVLTGPLTPLRIADEMLLVRRIRVGEGDLVQGAWLDGDVMRRDLLAQAADLLPDASLALVDPESGEDDPRRLASLPLRLEPGPVPVLADEGLTPIRIALLLAWGAALLGAGGAALLLRSAIGLGERRAAFVSAVTHELRTPLTTFRMYTDLLASDMVSDEKRGRYLDTLQHESDRLGHLVENVLAYAGLERGRDGGDREILPVAEVLERLYPTLTEAAERARMKLVIAEPEPAATVRVDRSALERIIRNLVDNACKYAVDADDRRIEVSVRAAGDEVTLTVSDHGPGIAPSDAARIFRPFRKSATEAAHTAPGVGLGLALSRSLARAMGGDLRLIPNAPCGARFALTLPRAAP